MSLAALALTDFEILKFKIYDLEKVGQYHYVRNGFIRFTNNQF